MTNPWLTGQSVLRSPASQQAVALLASSNSPAMRHQHLHTGSGIPLPQVPRAVEAAVEP